MMMNLSSSVSLSAMQRLAISLSREELYVVMRLIKATQIPGFALDWLHSGSEPEDTFPDQTRHALTVATNALVARGYLTQEPTTDAKPLALRLPSFVVALVGACAFSTCMITLLQRTTTGSRLIYFHAFHNLWVMHTMPVAHVHQFEALEDSVGVQRVIDELLGLDQQQALPSCPKGKAFAVHVQAARDAALTGATEDACKVLVHGGLSAILAQTFVEAIQAASILGAITVVTRGIDNQIQQATLALVTTPLTCFMLQDDGATPTAFLIRSASADAVRTWYAEQMQEKVE